ncbi:TonB family protein [Myxococcota bacterium]|nr:TonB family protein [Myxococcota bacterium]MBU1898707.1 TonB family protein [Myxococcota bacterium]
MKHALTPIKLDVYAQGQIVHTEILREQKIKIGRQPSAHLRLDHESVSRMHALIEVNGPDEVVLFDFGGLAGTWVNGARITRHALRSGDRLRFGAVEVGVHVAGQRPTREEGRSPARHVALFDEEEAPNAPRALEILALWGETVVNVQHLTKPGVFTIGDSDLASQFVAPDLLPEDPYPVAVFDGEQMRVHLPDGVEAEVLIDGVVYRLDDLKAAAKVTPSTSPRGQALILPPKGRCRLRLGEMTLLINSVTSAPAPATPSPFEVLEVQQVFFLGLAALLHGLYFALALSMPEGMGALRVDHLDLADRFTESFFKPEVDAPQEPEVEDLFGGLSEGDPSAKAKGPEGAMGALDAPDQDRRAAVKGPLDEALRKARARTQAVATAQAVTQQLEGVSGGVLAHEGALSGAPIDAYGHLSGAQVGDARGVNGLGQIGVGPGGGGWDNGSIGVGPPQTHGPGGDPRRGPRRGVTRVGEREAKVPKATIGKPEIRGGLEKEIIGRVVRQHRNEYRYCYEKALNAKRDLEGKIVVKFTISGAGEVIAARVEESTMQDEAVERCLTTKIRRWFFPAPAGGGIVTVRYPFIFKAN